MTRVSNKTTSSNKKKTESFVSSYLLYLLAAVSDAASSQFHQRVRASGLRVPEWRVLACLHDQDGEMITRLADYSLVEQSRLTRIIDQMDEKGLVKRKTDDLDRRRVRVYLTARGRKLTKELVVDAKSHEQQLLASLGQAKSGDIKNTLKMLLSSLKECEKTD